MCISDRTKALQKIFRGLGIDWCICDEAEAVNTLENNKLLRHSYRFQNALQSFS